MCIKSKVRKFIVKGLRGIPLSKPTNNAMHREIRATTEVPSLEKIGMHNTQGSQ